MNMGEAYDRSRIQQQNSRGVTLRLFCAHISTGVVAFTFCFLKASLHVRSASTLRTLCCEKKEKSHMEKPPEDEMSHGERRSAGEKGGEKGDTHCHHRAQRDQTRECRRHLGKSPPAPADFAGSEMNHLDNPSRNA